MDSLEIFQNRGYELLIAKHRGLLDDLKQQIFDRAKGLVPYRGESADEFFNLFHRYELSNTDLNRVRVNLVDVISRELGIPEKVFKCFEDVLLKLVGPDVAAQKLVNLVIQPPADREQAPIHRDAPLNSNYEVIVWLPLVDVYGTKSMFVQDKRNSLKGVEMLKSGRSYAEYCDFSRQGAHDLKASFGEAYFLAAGLTHGCHVNVEPETRWTLNLRYKGLFTPYGSKGMPEFFRIIHLSPLTQVAFEFDRIEHEQRLSP